MKFPHERFGERSGGVLAQDDLHALHQLVRVAGFALFAPSRAGEDGSPLGGDDRLDLILGEVRALDAGRAPHRPHNVERMQPPLDGRRQRNAARDAGEGAYLRKRLNRHAWA